MSSYSMIAQLEKKFALTRIHDIFIVLLGLALMTLLAQLKYYLPWSPVPLTGQTLGLLLVVLFYGQRRSSLIFASYVGGGLLGLPLFAHAALAGPTMGYLLGMFLSCVLVGHWIDTHPVRSFGAYVFLGLLIHLVVYAVGAAWLSFFVPTQRLWATGVAPFLVGDAVKIWAAGALMHQLSKKFK
jgi:biotin transport system substrate-specific component